MSILKGLDIYGYDDTGTKPEKYPDGGLSWQMKEAERLKKPSCGTKLRHGYGYTSKVSFLKGDIQEAEDTRNNRICLKNERIARHRRKKLAQPRRIVLRYGAYPHKSSSDINTFYMSRVSEMALHGKVLRNHRVHKDYALCQGAVL